LLIVCVKSGPLLQINENEVGSAETGQSEEDDFILNFKVAKRSDFLKSNLPVFSFKK